MWNHSVITNAGAALLDGWLDGKVFNFDAAVGGTGTVAPVALMAQTALVNQKQTLSIVGHEKIPSGIRLHIQITAPSAGYVCNQIGVRASIDGGPSTLLALYQDEEGIRVPSAAEMPDFVYSFYGTIAISNTGEFTVAIDTAALVSRATLDAAIDEAKAEVAAELAKNYQAVLTQAVVTLTAAGWTNKQQTVTVTGVTASNIVWVSPAPESKDAYEAAGVYATAQASNALTFTCEAVPVANVQVNVAIAK